MSDNQQCRENNPHWIHISWNFIWWKWAFPVICFQRKCFFYRFILFGWLRKEPVWNQFGSFVPQNTEKFQRNKTKNLLNLISKSNLYLVERLLLIYTSTALMFAIARWHFMYFVWAIIHLIFVYKLINQIASAFGSAKLLLHSVKCVNNKTDNNNQ